MHTSIKEHISTNTNDVKNYWESYFLQQKLGTSDAENVVVFEFIEVIISCPFGLFLKCVKKLFLYHRLVYTNIITVDLLHTLYDSEKGEVEKMTHVFEAVFG